MSPNKHIYLVIKAPSPPMVLSWYSWNWPLTKRSTRLDFPTADSPRSTSLNWQILLLAAVPLVRAGPPRPAILKCWKLRSWKVLGRGEEGWLKALGVSAEGWWSWGRRRWVQVMQVAFREEDDASLMGAGKENNVFTGKHTTPFF